MSQTEVIVRTEVRVRILIVIGNRKSSSSACGGELSEFRLLSIPPRMVAGGRTRMRGAAIFRHGVAFDWPEGGREVRSTFEIGTPCGMAGRHSVGKFFPSMANEFDVRNGLADPSHSSDHEGDCEPEPMDLPRQSLSTGSDVNLMIKILGRSDAVRLEVLRWAIG